MIHAGSPPLYTDGAHPVVEMALQEAGKRFARLLAQPSNTDALHSSRRNKTIKQLRVEIDSLPAAQREAFRLMLSLIEES